MAERTIGADGRVRSVYTVESIEEKDGSYTVDTTDHSGFVSSEDLSALKAGDNFVLETVQGSRITGVRVNGEWLYHYSDEDLAKQHQAWKDAWEKQKADELAEHRDRWQKQEDALPDWLRKRLQGFHETGGVNFELSGWGYELTVAELTALYVASKGADDDKVNEYAEKYGTSGHQHSVARMFAMAHAEDSEIPQISALNPITGDPDYSKGE